MKRIITIALMLTLVMTGLFAFNRGMGERMQEKRGNHEGFFRMSEECIEELELTDTQKEEINDLRVDLKKKGIKLNSEMAILRVEKREALRNEDFKEAKKIITQLSDKQEEKQLLRLSHQEEISKILTEEQKEIWREMRMKRPNRRMPMQNKDGNGRYNRQGEGRGRF